MFDIAFSELLVIGVVALVVIGPERLPRVARTLGHLFGRLQRYVSQVKSDINREVDLAEFKRMKAEVETAAESLKSGIESETRQAEQAIQAVESDIERQLAGQEGPATSNPGIASSAPEVAAHPEPASVSPQLELAIEEPPAAAAPARREAGSP